MREQNPTTLCLVTMPTPNAIYRFGPYELRTRTREVYKNRIKLKLRLQPFQVMQALVERAGDVVTREELRQLLWPAETFVDFEHGLNTSIKELRGLLNDSATEPRYIETLPKLGYRLLVRVSTTCAEVETLEVSRPSKGSSTAATASESTTSRSNQIARGGWRLALLAAFGLSAALLAKYFFHPNRALALRERDTIVLADFENATGEQIFDDALRQGLAAGLEQSPYFRVLSDRKSSVILKQMGRSPDERVTGQTAIELCQRAGSKVMVQGSISSLGTNYVIGLTAIRCDTSDGLAHEQTEAKRKEDVISALGTASTRLRKHLGEPTLSIQKYNAPLEQATTTSLEALKTYGMAMLALKGGDRPAIPLFKKATELDPGFGMAYGRLAGIYQNLGETELARENALKAFQLQDRLTESERLVIESWYNVYVTGDLEKAAQLNEMELQNYPASAGVLNDLGNIYFNLGRQEKATEFFRQSLAMNPNVSITYGNLAGALLATGHVGEARAVLADAESQKMPTDYYLLQVHYWEAFVEGNTKEMEGILSQAASVPGARALLLSEQARTEAYFGRFEKSRRLSELAAKLMANGGEKESAAACLAELALREAEIGDARLARRTVLHALQLARSQTIVTLAALVMAHTGDFQQSQTLVEELNKKYPSDTFIQKYWLPTIRARIELGQGNWSKGLETMSITEPFDFAAAPALTTITLYPAYVRGEIYMAGGNGKQAAAEFSKLVEHQGMVLNFFLGALARLRRAQACALAGDSAKAQDSYQEFFALWKEADPSLPLLRQAKREYESFLKSHT